MSYDERLKKLICYTFQEKAMVGQEDGRDI